MSGHLCLKWNNHSSAFLKSISSIQLKEKYCDATIACQGKYFPVHRIILSTCSDYFNEIFDRMQCQHPYIVFKDIEPREMELLLNYMYIGEINVAQEQLPTLIKAAESLKIKGLAVPDDMPPSTDSSTRKRRSNALSPSPKRKAEERRVRQRSSSELNSARVSGDGELALQTEGRSIKEEPLDTSDLIEIPFGSADGDGVPDLPLKPNPGGKDEGVFTELSQFPETENSLTTFIKTEVGTEGDQQPFDGQSDAWSEFGGASSALSDLPPMEDSSQDDILQTTRPDVGNSVRNFPSSSQARFTNVGLRGEHPVPTFRCPHCAYESVRSKHVEKHIRFKHTGERPFTCSVCSKRFADKSGMIRHRRVHSGEKPFQCQMCFKKFSKRVTLNLHVAREHYPPGGYGAV